MSRGTATLLVTEGGAAGRAHGIAALVAHAGQTMTGAIKPSAAVDEQPGKGEKDCKSDQEKEDKLTHGQPPKSS